MSKLELWSQERMDKRAVPLPDKKGFRDFGEYVKVDSIPAADVVPAVELEDLRAKYQALVAEKDKNSGDTAETYTTGYRYGHRNGQIELLQQILNICDSTSEQEE